MEESGKKPRKKHWGAAFKSAGIFFAVFVFLSVIVAIRDLEGGLKKLKQYPEVIVMVGIVIFLIVLAKFIHTLYHGPSKWRRY